MESVFLEILGPSSRTISGVFHICFFWHDPTAQSFLFCVCLKISSTAGVKEG